MLNVDVGTDPLPGFGKQSDRQAAHYYRSLHQRAARREEQWRAKALAAEQIIKQLLVLIGCLLEEIKPLRRQLAWLKKQVFGRKTEKGQDLPGQEAGPLPGPAGLADGSGKTDLIGAGTGAKRKRRRGQQPGAKGPRRKVPVDLPVEEIHHRLGESQRTCGCCGKVRPEIGLVEESREIGWKVELVLRKHIRHRYGPGCDCARGGGIITAPRPAKLIPKGLFAVDFWVEVLLKKFEFQQPIQRIVGELQAHGLAVSAGSLGGGLQKIGRLLGPLAGRFVLQAQQGSHWHMDETRWPMFCQVEGKGRELYWFWVVVSGQVTVFLLEDSRSGKVPRTFFAKGTEGTLNVDRYGGYFKLLGEDWKIELAYCWAHQRRDFVNLGGSGDAVGLWAGEWIGLINELFAINARRRHLWFGGQGVAGESLAGLDQAVRQRMSRMKERLDLELAGGTLAVEQEKLLRSMRRHWAGLSVFVEKPRVPMDNNAAERALRPLAVGRKNFYGSGSAWSGELASTAFTLLATARQQGICPRRFLQSYLEACAQNGGRAPEDLEPFLPWNWSAEKRAAWGRKERPP